MVNLCSRDKITGFTLIELLVVIAIISLLASIVFTSLTGARAKAKNAAIVASVEQWRNALALYYSDNSGYYKTGMTVCLGGTSACVAPPTVNIDPAFNSAMNAYITGTPNPNINFVDAPAQQYKSLYWSNCSTGVCPTARLFWFLYGNVTCGSGAQTLSMGTNTQCILNI